MARRKLASWRFFPFFLQKAESLARGVQLLITAHLVGCNILLGA
ncbi:hypothetical protein [Pyrobaculum genetic element 1]|nr:hypothetical protein [Pyrobaculum genetic element 1]